MAAKQGPYDTARENLKGEITGLLAEVNDGIMPLYMILFLNINNGIDLTRSAYIQNIDEAAVGQIGDGIFRKLQSFAARHRVPIVTTVDKQLAPIDYCLWKKAEQAPEEGKEGHGGGNGAKRARHV